MTVAMADPTDVAAREAIASDLGVEPYIVQGDRVSIDRFVAELWREEEQAPAHLLAYAPVDSRVDETGAYADYLTDLLSASIEYVPGDATVDKLVEKTRQDHELVIMDRPDDSARASLFSGAPELMALSCLSVSMLIVHRPCWPLHKLLLVVQGDPSDERATDWTMRLAGPSGASVTAVAVVPPVPPMHHGQGRMERGLAELLVVDTPLGRQMRRVARRLVDRGVEGTLRLRQGSPDWEIRHELVEGQFDLAVIGGASRSGVRRLVLGDLAASLTRIVDRPMLVAR